MNDLLERLEQEQSNLEDMMSKLEAFIISDEFLTVSEKQQELLEEQSCAMSSYNEILLERIFDLRHGN